MTEHRGQGQHAASATGAQARWSWPRKRVVSASSSGHRRPSPGRSEPQLSAPHPPRVGSCGSGLDGDRGA